MTCNAVQYWPLALELTLVNQFPCAPQQNDLEGALAVFREAVKQVLKQLVQIEFVLLVVSHIPTGAPLNFVYFCFVSRRSKSSPRIHATCCCISAPSMPRKRDQMATGLRPRHSPATCRFKSTE